MSSDAPTSIKKMDAKVSASETKQAVPAPAAQPWKEHVQFKVPQTVNFVGEVGNIRLIDGRVDGKVVGG